jgi:hypothetical protein
MSFEVDYLPVATAAGNNADTQANFLGSGYQLNGFVNGMAQPSQANKLWRQSSMIAAAVANFVSNQLQINVIDDGNLAALITNLTNAIASAAQGSASRLVSVAYSATPVFDASQGNSFEIVLTGNNTSATLINYTPGQSLTFIVKQDGVGTRVFTPPTNLPMASIDGAASSTNVQHFIVDSGSNVYPKSPLMVS